MFSFIWLIESLLKLVLINTVELVLTTRTIVTVIEYSQAQYANSMIDTCMTSI